MAHRKTEWRERPVFWGKSEAAWDGLKQRFAGLPLRHTLRVHSIGNAAQAAIAAAQFPVSSGVWLTQLCHAASTMLIRPQFLRHTRFFKPSSVVAARNARSFWLFSTCDRVRSSVRPSCAALFEAAGRYGDPRTRSKSVLSSFAARDGLLVFPIRICSIIRPFWSSTSHTPSPTSGRVVLRNVHAAACAGSL